MPLAQKSLRSRGGEGRGREVDGLGLGWVKGKMGSGDYFRDKLMVFFSFLDQGKKKVSKLENQPPWAV